MTIHEALGSFRLDFQRFQHIFIVYFEVGGYGMGLTNEALSGLELSQTHRNSPAFVFLVLRLQVACVWAFE